MVQSRRLIHLFAFAIVVACGESTTGPAASFRGNRPDRDEGSSGCQNVSGTDVAQFTSPTTATGTLSGDLTGTFDAVIDEIRPGDDGSLHLVAHRTITLEGGTITTSDHGVLSPVESPLYRANGHYLILGGTGIYEGATGRIDIHGDVDLGSGAVNLTYHGHVCVKG